MEKCVQLVFARTFDVHFSIFRIGCFDCPHLFVCGCVTHSATIGLLKIPYFAIVYTVYWHLFEPQYAAVSLYGMYIIVIVVAVVVVCSSTTHSYFCVFPSYLAVVDRTTRHSGSAVRVYGQVAPNRMHIYTFN